MTQIDWIKAEDRVPEDENRRLVTVETRKGDNRYVSVAWHSSYHGWVGSIGTGHVVAWAEIEPYMGDKE